MNLFQGSINGCLFFIKHLLILREQISPFDVDFAIKEVALDFTKLRSAAYGLLAKGSQILSIGSNNAILEFLLEVSEIFDLVRFRRRSSLILSNV